MSQEVKNYRAERRALIQMCQRVIDARDSDELPSAIYELEKLVHSITEPGVPMKGPDYDAWLLQAEEQAIRALEKGKTEFHVSVRYLLRRDRERVRNFIHRRVRKTGKNSRIRWNQKDNRMYVTILDEENDG